MATSEITLWIAFSAGLLSFFSPCVLPLIPSYLTYISGLTFGQLQEEHLAAKVRLSVLFHSLVFIAGFSFVFIALGALVGLASASFQYYLHNSLGIIQKVGGVLIFVLGVHVSGLFPLTFLLGEKRLQLRHRPAGYVGTFVVGIAFAAGWTPCIGPILGTILAIAAGTSGSVANGVVLLAIYSAGLGIPFLIAGLLFHAFLSFFNRFKRYLPRIEILTGLLLMMVGALLFFDGLSWIASYLYRILPDTLLP